MRSERERLSGSDEIDLVEVVQGVWREKLWILAVAFLVLAVGGTYLMLAKPVYEARLYVQPPSQTDIAQLNYARGGNTGLDVWGVKDVYEVYLRVLQSEAVRSKFFRTIYLPSLPDSRRAGSRDELYKEFAKVLKVAVAAKDSPTRYVITSELGDPKQAAEWVVRYVAIASDLAKQEILKSNQSEMHIKSDNIEQQIAAARASARKEREDKIARLKEWLIVAKAIGLKKPPLISGNLSAEVSAGMEGALSYMRGSDALESEIANLESRTSDDPFIKGLRTKQQALDLYRNLRVAPEVISVYQQDGFVEQPETPIRPKKLMVLVLTVLAAVVLGLFAGLVRYQWSRLRRG